MDIAKRDRLERSCALCREVGAPDDQLLMVRLDEVEELLRADKLLGEMLSTMDELDRIKRKLKEDREKGVSDGHAQTDGGEEPGDCEGNP